MEGSGDVVEESVLLPGLIDVLSDQNTLLGEPADPCFRATESDWRLIVFLCVAPASIKGKLFERLTRAHSLVFDGLDGIGSFREIFLTSEVKKGWVAADLHFGAERLAEVGCAVDFSDVDLITV